MDPRVKTSLAELQQQHDLSVMMYKDRLQTLNAIAEIRQLRRKIKEKLPDATGPAITDLNQCDEQAAALETVPQGSSDASFGKLNAAFATVLNILQDADVAPTSQAVAAAKDADRSFDVLMLKWAEVKKKLQSCLGEK
jgi:hypothetical protein